MCCKVFYLLNIYTIINSITDRVINVKFYFEFNILLLLILSCSYCLDLLLVSSYQLFYYMLSLSILKTILYSSDVLFDSSKSLSSIMAILFAIYLYSSNTIIPKSLEYLVFYNGNTPIKLSLLWWGSSIDIFSVFYY